MKSEGNKILSTIGIVLASAALYVIWMVYMGKSGREVSSFLGILVACIPAFAIHAIWNTKVSKNE